MRIGLLKAHEQNLILLYPALASARNPPVSIGTLPSAEIRYSCENPVVVQFPVILSKRSLRSEGSGRAARNAAFLAAQQSRVWLLPHQTAPLPKIPHPASSLACLIT